MKLNSLFMLIKPAANTAANGSKDIAKEESGAFLKILGGLFKQPAVEKKTQTVNTEEPQINKSAVLGVKKSIVVDKGDSKTNDNKSVIEESGDKFTKKSKGDASPVAEVEEAEAETKKSIKKNAIASDSENEQKIAPKGKVQTESPQIETVKGNTDSSIQKIDSNPVSKKTTEKIASDEESIANDNVSVKSSSEDVTIAVEGAEAEEVIDKVAEEPSSILKSVRTAAASLLSIFKPDSAGKTAERLSDQIVVQGKEKVAQNSPTEKPSADSILRSNDKAPAVNAKLSTAQSKTVATETGKQKTESSESANTLNKEPDILTASTAKKSSGEKIENRPESTTASKDAKVAITFGGKPTQPVSINEAKTAEPARVTSQKQIVVESSDSSIKREPVVQKSIADSDSSKLKMVLADGSEVEGKEISTSRIERNAANSEAGTRVKPSLQADKSSVPLAEQGAKHGAEQPGIAGKKSISNNAMKQVSEILTSEQNETKTTPGTKQGTSKSSSPIGEQPSLSRTAFQSVSVKVSDKSATTSRGSSEKNSTNQIRTNSSVDEPVIENVQSTSKQAIEETVGSSAKVIQTEASRISESVAQFVHRSGKPNDRVYPENTPAAGQNKPENGSDKNLQESKLTSNNETIKATAQSEPVEAHGSNPRKASASEKIIQLTDSEGSHESTKRSHVNAEAPTRLRSDSTSQKTVVGDQSPQSRAEVDQRMNADSRSTAGDKMANEMPLAGDRYSAGDLQKNVAVGESAKQSANELSGRPHRPIAAETTRADDSKAAYPVRESKESLVETPVAGKDRKDSSDRVPAKKIRKEQGAPSSRTENSSQKNSAVTRSETKINETAGETSSPKEIQIPKGNVIVESSRPVSETKHRSSKPTIAKSSIQGTEINNAGNESVKKAEISVAGSRPIENSSGSRRSILSDIWKQHLAPAGEKVIQSLSLPGAIRAIKNWSSESTRSVSKDNTGLGTGVTSKPVTKPKSQQAESQTVVETNKPVHTTSRVSQNQVGDSAENTKVPISKLANPVETGQVQPQGTNNGTEATLQSPNNTIAETETTTLNKTTKSVSPASVQGEKPRLNQIKGEETVTGKQFSNHSEVTKTSERINLNNTRQASNTEESTVKDTDTAPTPASSKGSRIRSIWGVRFGHREVVEPTVNRAIPGQAEKLQTAESRVLNSNHSKKIQSKTIASHYPSETSQSAKSPNRESSSKEDAIQSVRGNDKPGVQAGRNSEALANEPTQKITKPVTVAETSRTKTPLQTANEATVDAESEVLVKSAEMPTKNGSERRLSTVEAKPETKNSIQSEPKLTTEETSTAKPDGVAKGSRLAAKNDAVSVRPENGQAVPVSEQEFRNRESETARSSAPSSSFERANSVAKVASTSEKPLETTQRSTGSEKPSPVRSQNASGSVAATTPKTDSSGGQQQHSAQNESQQQTGQGIQTSATEMQQTNTTARSEFSTFIPRLSSDDIRELQTLVQKALESSRKAQLDTKEVKFEWRQKDLGNVRFLISTQESDVKIMIQADRTEVAEAIDKSRAVVERMITDQGLRVERFDVQVRVPADPQANTNQFSQQRQADANMQKSDQQPNNANTRESTQNTSKEQAPSPRSRTLQGDREWVA